MAHLYRYHVHICMYVQPEVKLTSRAILICGKILTAKILVGVVRDVHQSAKKAELFLREKFSAIHYGTKFAHNHSSVKLVFDAATNTVPSTS